MEDDFFLIAGCTPLNKMLQLIHCQLFLRGLRDLAATFV